MILPLFLPLGCCFDWIDYIKHLRKCFTNYLNIFNFIKNTLLRILFSTVFSIFEYPNETLSHKFDILGPLLFCFELLLFCMSFSRCLLLQLIFSEHFSLKMTQAIGVKWFFYCRWVKWNQEIVSLAWVGGSWVVGCGSCVKIMQDFIISSMVHMMKSAVFVPISLI